MLNLFPHINTDREDENIYIMYDDEMNRFINCRVDEKSECSS